MIERLPEGETRLESILISAAALQARVDELAQAIARDHPGADPLHLVAVLKGAWIFLADLARALRRRGGPAAQYHFIRATTYGSGMKGAAEHSRQVRLEGLPTAVRGGTVVLVEDILDQGFTLAGIRQALFDDAGARAVRLCVLLDKHLDTPTPAVARLRQSLVPDYVGFSVPDRWVAGYGLDVAEEFRDLPYIAVVREECFR